MEDISSPCVNWDFDLYDYNILILISFVFSPFENEIHIAGEWKMVFTHKFYLGAKGWGKTQCRVTFPSLLVASSY